MHTSIKRLLAFLSIAIIVVTTIGLPTQRAHASTTFVTSAADNGPGTLRDVIAAAAPNEQIRFNITGGCPCTIFLNTPISFNKNLDIEGLSNPTDIVIRPTMDYANGLFNITGGTTNRFANLKLMRGGSVSLGAAINSTGMLTLEKMTFENNRVSNTGTVNGGAVYMVGPLSITNSTFKDNYAQSTGGNALGGALYIDASLQNVTISNTTFDHNGAGANSATVNGFSHGGAIYVAGGNIDLQNNTMFSANDPGGTSEGKGGAIYVNNGTLTSPALSGVTYSYNHALTNGGAIYINLGANTSYNLNSNCFDNNSANDTGGAIFSNPNVASSLTGASFKNNSALKGAAIGHGNSGLTITNSSFTANDAIGNGVIYLNGGTTYIAKSTFNANLHSGAANDGAVIYNNLIGATLYLANSTISDNYFMGTAGGAPIYSKGTTTITNSTIAHNAMRSGPNSAGGIFQAAGTLHIGNTIVATNSIEFTAHDIQGTINSDGHNFVYSRAGSTGYVASDLAPGLDPHLASLADNGGTTKTIALFSNSPAVDAGDNAICAAPPISNFDQRDAIRPVDGDGDATITCDIGSFELPVKPSLALSLSAGSIAVGMPVTLTHTISNPTIGNTFSNIAFTNQLPPSLEIAETPNIVNNCGTQGTVVAAPGGNVISVSDVALTNATCTISVKIVSKHTGLYNIQANGFSSLQTGGVNPSNTVLLRVGVLPTVSLSLSPSVLKVGAITDVIHTLTNPNPSMTLSNIAVAHTFPGALTVENPTSDCGGSAVLNLNTLNISGVTLSPGQSCTVRVDASNMSGTGSYLLGTDPITALETGTGKPSNRATLVVVNAPTITLALAPAMTYPGGLSRFEYTLTNPNPLHTLTNIAFSHPLAGVLVASTPNITNNCSAPGSVSAPPAANTVTVGGIQLEGGKSCKITVNVSGNTGGSFPNTTAPISSAETGAGVGSNTVNLNINTYNVYARLIATQDLITVGNTVQLTYYLTNNAVSNGGLSITQTLPPTLRLPVTSAFNSTCGGTPIITVAAQRDAFSITGLTLLQSSSCTITFNVIGQQSGRYRTGYTATSPTLGTVPPSNEVLIDVISDPALLLDLTPRTLNTNNITRVTLRLNNQNQIPMTGAGFTYNLNGITVAPTPDIVNTCGGTPNVTANATTVNLAGTTLTAGQSCTISFNAKASNTPGNYLNRTQAMATIESGGGAVSNDVVLKVYSPPTLATSLSSAAIKTGGTTVLTYTITNPNATNTGLSAIGFVHDLPPQVTIDSIPNIGGTCGNIGTAVSAPAGGSHIIVDGLTLAQAQTSCTVMVTLTSTITGEYTLQAGSFFTLQGGPGAASSSVTLRVARYDCTLSGLDTAFTNGGNATFACSSVTALTLTAQKSVALDTNLDGGGLLRISSSLPLPPGGIRPNARDGRIFGAIQVESGATLRISGVTFDANSDPTVPPLGITGTAVITNVTFTGNVNSGALIAYTGANVTIYNSTFANNTVVNDSTQSDGAALYLEPDTTVNVYNSTFANNSVSSSSLSQHGGAIYAATGSTLNLTNVTLSGNNANGTGKTIFVESGASVTMTNSIITNTVTGNCLGTINDGGHNLQFPDNSCGGSIPVSNPMLNALASNGGHTNTMSLQAGSPALGAGDFNVCQTTLKNVDQRGYIRQSGNTICDIGAFENAAQIPSLNIVAPNSVPIGEPFNVTVSALDVGNNIVTGYLGNVHFTSSNVNATLPTDYTFQDTDNGVHTFSMTLNQTGTFSLAVTDSQNNATTITDNTTVAVLYHPTIGVSFAPASISPNGQTAIRVALTNTNTVALNQVGLIINLPANVTIANMPTITNTCGDGDVSAIAGDSEIDVANVTLSSSESCLITVQITSNMAGSYQIQATSIEAQETGTAPDGAEVLLNVGAAAPTVIFTFAPNAIKVNNTSVLTYTIQNNDSGALTNLSFTHNLPSGLVVAETPGVAVSCAITGTVTATAGSGTITVTGVGLSSAQSCTIQVNGTTNLNSGVFTTSISNVTTTETGATSAVSNSDSLTVTVGKRDTVGIYRPSLQKFYLRNSNTTGPADITVTVGGFAPNSNYKPVVGDWNGDQIDTVGLYDRATGWFYLSDSNVTGTVNYTLLMGNPSDLPLSGRWSPDMSHDGVGTYRPSNGILYLKKELSTGFSDYYAVMGNPTDFGITGDFNGDGIDTVGIYRPSESRFYISNSTPNGITFADFSLLLGNATEDDPFTGDWVGQGHSGVGVFRRANGIIYLKNSMSGIFSDTYLVYGIAGDVPVAGRWTSGALPAPLSGINGVVVQPGTGSVNPDGAGNTD